MMFLFTAYGTDMENLVVSLIGPNMKFYRGQSLCKVKGLQCLLDECYLMKLEWLNLVLLLHNLRKGMLKFQSGAHEYTTKYSVIRPVF